MRLDHETLPLKRSDKDLDPLASDEARRFIGHYLGVHKLYLDPLASDEARPPPQLKVTLSNDLDPLASDEARHVVGFNSSRKSKFRSTSL